MQRDRKLISLWLLTMIGLVLSMIFIGGITRLTDSGLSIVDWRPLMGAIPPLHEVEWLEIFEKYKQYPEYKLINEGMSLFEFKKIFFWEYFHRLIGRMIGVVFLIPFIYFLATKKMTRGFALKVFVGFILGGMQGLLGWYMVKSGLVERPDVSHYRLAAHLSLAMLIMGYYFWLYLGINQIYDVKKVFPTLRKALLVFMGILILQIFYGAFVAGLDAGIGYNTFPKMNGEWIPRALNFFKPWWLNLFENNVAVQFIHRKLGWTLFFMANILSYFGFKQALTAHQKNALSFVLFMVWVQFSLGIITLVLTVPVYIASLHQIGASILLLATLRCIFVMSPCSIEFQSIKK